MGTFPVEMKHYRSTDLNNAMGQLFEQVIVPGLLLKDINGDQIQDLSSVEARPCRQSSKSAAWVSSGN